jgi:hypothetical protein
METEVFIKSLILLFLSLVEIDNLPLLILAIVFLPDDNWSAFFISTTIYIKASVGILEVAEVVSLILENLPPSRVSAPDLEVV